MSVGIYPRPLRLCEKVSRERLLISQEKRIEHAVEVGESRDENLTTCALLAEKGLLSLKSGMILYHCFWPLLSLLTTFVGSICFFFA